MVFAFGNQRRIGVSTMQLTKQLAEYFGVAEGTGVLVTAVTEDGPAGESWCESRRRDHGGRW